MENKEDGDDLRLELVVRRRVRWLRMNIRCEQLLMVLLLLHG
jgi:hypothetical protein